MPTQLYRAMRLPSAGQYAGGAKAYRMRPEKAQLCRGLTFPATGARLRPLAGARCFTRVRVRWAVRRRLHLAPQRHVGGSPLTQQTATRPRHRHTAYMTKTNEPYVGNSMKAPPRRRKAKIPMTTRPCHTLGRPQPQP